MSRRMVGWIGTVEKISNTTLKAYQEDTPDYCPSTSHFGPRLTKLETDNGLLTAFSREKAYRFCINLSQFHILTINLS